MTEKHILSEPNGSCLTYPCSLRNLFLNKHLIFYYKIPCPIALDVCMSAGQSGTLYSSYLNFGVKW
jgi:hypothetical protein